MTIQFHFAKIDLKDSELLAMYGVQSTKKNVSLMVQMCREYLDGLSALQQSIKDKYRDQFELQGEAATKEQINELFGVQYEKPEYRNLFYT
jgi:hypothetical protein